jgi:hypothetical protein
MLQAAAAGANRSALKPLGDSLAVELLALTRAALVRIQVPQPITAQSVNLQKKQTKSIV